MERIPQPEILDADRSLRKRGTELLEDDRPEAELLAAALHESCAYANQLWHHLDAMRTYLIDSLPANQHEQGADATDAASQADSDYNARWNQWINAYGAVTSVLCGPHGDGGFGLEEAHRESESRRGQTCRRGPESG